MKNGPTSSFAMFRSRFFLPEILRAPAGGQERRERRAARADKDASNLRSLLPQQAAARVVIRTLMEEQSDVLRQLLAQTVAITAPAADAWNGIIAAERGGEKLARDRQSQVKEYMAKAVEEIGAQITQGASMHQLAEAYGVKERRQTQGLPPFKSRAPAAVLVSIPH